MKDFSKRGVPSHGTVDEILLRSGSKHIWKERHQAGYSFYCPLCRAPRKIPFNPRPGSPRHVAQVALSTAVLMLLTWNWFTWKGVILFVPLWIGFETFYRARVRAAVSCAQCGFDPFLYLIDVQRARKEVETHWRKKFQEKGVPYPGDPLAPSPSPRAATAEEAVDGDNDLPRPTAPPGSA